MKRFPVIALKSHDGIRRTVREQIYEMRLQIIPPSFGKFIVTRSPSSFGILHLVIKDIKGTVVKELTMESSSDEIEINIDLPSQLFILEVVSETGKSQFKLMKL